METENKTEDMTLEDFTPERLIDALIRVTEKPIRELNGLKERLEDCTVAFIDKEGRIVDLSSGPARDLCDMVKDAVIQTLDEKCKEANEELAKVKTEWANIRKDDKR